MLLNYIKLAQYYFKKRVFETKIKDLIQIDETNNPGDKIRIPSCFQFNKFVKDLKTNLLPNQRFQFPFYYLTDYYLACELSDKHYEHFHNYSLPTALGKFIQKTISSSFSQQFKLITIFQSNHKFESKFLHETEIIRSKHHNFYKQHFSTWFLERIPKTQKLSQLLYLIVDNRIFFMIWSQQNLIIDVKIYMFVPNVYIKDTSYLNINFFQLKIEGLLDFKTFLTFLLEEEDQNCKGMIVQHIMTFISNHSLGHPFFFRFANVFIRGFEGMGFIDNMEEHKFVETFYAEEMKNNHLPCLFNTYLDSSKLKFEGIIKCKSFIFYENTERLNNSMNIIDEIELDYFNKKQNSKFKNFSGKKNQKIKCFLVLTFLYRAPKIICEEAFAIIQKDLVEKLQKTLFRNFYLPLLIELAIKSKNLTFSQILPHFRSFTVG